MARRFSMDRRAYLKTVGAVGAASAIAGCSGGSDSETLVPGTNAAFAPFEFEENGDIVGFDIDLAEEAIDRAGYEAGSWSDLEFGSLIPSLNNGDIDLIAAGMTIEPDRQEQIDFTDPYWESNQSVLVQSDGDFQPEGESDLDGASVGVQGGTTGEGEAERLLEEGVIAEDDLERYPNYVLAVEDLEGGNVDAVIVDQPVAKNFSAERDVSVAFVIETGEQFGMGMRTDDDRLAEINDALAEIREDRTYDELVAEWFE
ncbi:transporter substrate-binding domain-containing protein [Halapricum desulfuricans]|nr:transporter substrate-binding domain-containing protein [Halapricum desulfuricans]